MGTYTGIFTDIGKTLLVQRISGHVAIPTSLYMAYGSGSAAATVYDRYLEAEYYSSRGVVDEATALGWRTSKVWTIAADQTIREIGLFDAAAGGNLLYRGVRSSDLSVEEDDTYTGQLYLCHSNKSGYPFHTAGLTEAKNLFDGQNSPAAFTHMAYGTGTGAENPSDTTLGTETDRVAADYLIWSAYAGQDTVRFYAECTAGSNLTVSEMAMFNAASGGDMLFRKLLASYLVVTTDQKFVLVNDVIITTGAYDGSCGS